MDMRAYAKDDEESSKRKRRAIAQGQRACNPCRTRKVRCSYELPCGTCVDRQHPQLCVYDAPVRRVPLGSMASASSTAYSSATHLPSPAISMMSSSPAYFPAQAPPRTTTTTTTTIASTKTQWAPSEGDWNQLLSKIDNIEESLRAVRKELARRPRSTRDAGADGYGSSPMPDEAVSDSAAAAADDDLGQELPHSVHPVTGERVFLGANSVPAMAMALSQQPANDSSIVRDLLDKSVLPIFTLENESTTYPFVDLWGLPHASPVRIEKLCAMLPSDSECLQYIRQYRDTAHVLFPGIVDIQQFEVQVTRFLVTRNTTPLHSAANPSGRPVLTENNVYGRSVHWLGLLFACLASGYQCSSLPRKERQLTSQVYVCCAYECLRITNYLSCCQLDDLQNLLVLGNVISNTMNAGVAWTLLGLTIRLAQGLGLHDDPRAQDLPSEDRILRHEIWSRIIWQDSLLSISYDRATPTANLTRWEISHPTKPTDGFSYSECMLQLCTIALDIVTRRARPMSLQRELQAIEERRNEVQSIAEQAHVHLRESSACALMGDHLEHWNWRMHCSYVVSELCRPMLARRGQDRHSHRQHEAAIANVRRVCIDALVDTVDAFLKLQNLTSFARTSWAAVHRSLGSALLLGILKESAKSEKVRAMLEQLITVMSNLEYADASEMPAPVTRAVQALQRLNIVVEGSTDQDDQGADPTSATPAGASTEESSGDSPHALMQRIIWGADDFQVPSAWGRDGAGDDFLGLSPRTTRD